MCGIIGYIGDKNASPILVNGLKRLEYRGYDSSGIGIVSLSDGKLALRKAHGKIANLEKLITSHPVPAGTVGISHTRWATHGAPNRVNAHPHADSSSKISTNQYGHARSHDQWQVDIAKCRMAYHSEKRREGDN